jgi:hypothetical protein
MQAKTVVPLLKWIKMRLMRMLPRMMPLPFSENLYKNKAMGQPSGDLLRKRVYFFVIHIHAMIFVCKLSASSNAYPKFRNIKFVCLNS